MVRKFRVIASTILEIANIFSEKCHKFSNFLLFHGLHLHILGDLFWNADFHPQYLIQYLHIMNQHKLCFHLTYFFFRLWIFLWKFEDRNKSIQQFYFNILNFCCGFWSKRANFGLVTLKVCPFKYWNWKFWTIDFWNWILKDYFWNWNLNKPLSRLFFKRETHLQQFITKQKLFGKWPE